MDIGFGLENFDSFARYQTKENGGAVNPSGAVYESTSVDPASGLILDAISFTDVAFQNYAGLASTLASDPRLDQCFASQVVAYAAGRTAAVNECAVQDTQAAQAGATSATVQGQFENYVQSKYFSLRAR
jgi:hypothetical protein